MARIGSVAAAPFVGDQFASLYLGATRVPTVPSAPEIIAVTEDSGQVSFDFYAPASDGGSTVTLYRFYINGQFVDEGEFAEATPASGVSADETLVPCEVGDIARVSAVNAVGEGPLSAPFTVVAP